MKKTFLIFILLIIVVFILRFYDLVSTQAIFSGIFAALILDWLRLNVENKKLRKK
jgi:hypothetical protein